MDSVGRHKVALPFVGLGDKSTVVPSGGDSGSLTLPNTKIYTIEDVWRNEGYNMQGESVQYIYIIDPEVTESISFSLSTNDFVGKSDDSKYRLLSNYEGNLCLVVAPSYDSEKTNFTREDFFAVVYKVALPNS